MIKPINTQSRIFNMRLIILMFSVLCITSLSFAQNEEGEKQTAPKPNFRKVSGIQERRTGIHDGNLVYTRFSNFGNLGSRYEPPKMEWPKGSGQWYGYEFIMIAGAEVVDKQGNTIHIISENYTNPGSFDISPDGTHTYGWEPLPGYFNSGAENKYNYPAMSHMKETWPQNWQYDYPGTPGSRDGYWNGEFGAYVRADQESYYVMDDRNNDEFAYYPFISNTQDTMSFPTGRRGLGLEVKVRGYQWSQVEAEDILIVRFDIQNVSEKDLSKAIFGMYVDPAIGGEGDSQDDNAFFDTEEDITYCWDLDGLDNKGRPGVGYFGYAFLESPGDPLNGSDDDEDGLIDERQDNGAGSIVFGPIGNYGEPKSHWSGDEDGDWRTFTDDNGDNKWSNGEDIGDDLGSDGIGPYDMDYPGPDSDGTEANGKPDHGEPNFGKTDNDESDQIGLTSFLLRPAGNISDDESTWNEMTPGMFSGLLPTNLAFIYGSGYFTLPRTETRKFAIANLFGNDFDDILRNKRTMQRIYNADYNFTKPPLLPKVTAVASDRKVILTWDDRAESSRDPIYGEDFEGYLIYRSTDPSFNQIKTITDSYGNPIFWQPIAQYDVKNGLTGPHPIAIGETGARFNMGKDTGLKYYFVDENVENGRTYYYAVCSYDKGYAEDFYSRGIVKQPNLANAPPSECTKIIQTDLLGNVIFVDRNCAVVVPNAPSAGYIKGSIIDGVTHTGVATGRIIVEPVLSDTIKNGNVYEITFLDTSKARITSGVRIKNITTGDTVYSANYFDADEIKSQIIDGMTMVFQNDTVGVKTKEWIPGPANLDVNIALLESPKTIPIPEDFEIRIGSPKSDTSHNPLAFLRQPVNFSVWSTSKNLKYKALFNERIFKDSLLNSGDEVVVVFDIKGFDYKTVWRLNFGDTLATTKITPQAGDILKFTVTKPFNIEDNYTFTTKAATVDLSRAKEQMENIYVVPDPYVVSASWEKPLFYSSGRGERRVDFVNLPQECTIRIYSASGKLVKTLEHSGTGSNGSHPWDLTTDDGLTVSFGIYIFHVDAPGIGSKIGKFAIIK